MKRMICILLALMLLTGCRTGSGTETTLPAEPTETTLPLTAPTLEQTLPWTEMTEPEKIPGFTIAGENAEALAFSNPGCVRVNYEGNRSYVRYVTDIDQLPAEEALQGYDAAFFENHALIVVYETVNSGSVRLELEEITVEAGTASVSIKRTISGDMGTSDMATWLLWAEVDRDLACDWEIANASALPGVEKY